jgi:surfactin synthase thioesterase subunit
MSPQPTVVLGHGAFADASGFGGVMRHLPAQGVPEKAPMKPLRGLASDAEAIRRSPPRSRGPIVLAGHSYGGAVTSQAAPAVKNVRADPQNPRISTARPWKLWQYARSGGTATWIGRRTPCR